MAFSTDARSTKSRRIVFISAEFLYQIYHTNSFSVNRII